MSLEEAVQRVITEVGDLRVGRGVCLSDLNFSEEANAPVVAFTVKDTENNVVEVYEAYKPTKMWEAYASRFTLDKGKPGHRGTDTQLHFNVCPLIGTKGKEFEGLYGNEWYALGLQRAIDDGSVTLVKDAGNKTLRFEKAA